MLLELERTAAPDFSLVDVHGEMRRLSAYRGEQHVVLVFNRGFTWPFCRRHLAQLRQDYEQFRNREAIIVVVGPEDTETFARHWQRKSYPFVGLPDPQHRVADLYGQEVNLLKLGRLPALLIIDKAGNIRFSHYGGSMQDIPSNEEVLSILERLNQEAYEAL